MNEQPRPGGIMYYSDDKPLIHSPSDISRLWWEGGPGVTGHGLVRHVGVTVDLTALPHIDGLPQHLRAIDYAPAMRVTLLRESAQAWREMTAPEREACAHFLVRVAGVVRGAVA